MNQGRFAFVACFACVTAAAGEARLSVAPASIAQRPDQSRSLQFSITRSGDTSIPLRLRFETHDGSALAGSDYAATVGHLIIPAGATDASIAVPVLPGASPDSRDFQLELSEAAPHVASFAEAIQTGVDANSRQVVAADLNADGRPDLVVTGASGTSFAVLLGGEPDAGRPTSTSHPFELGFVANAVAIGDLNTDGKPDLAFAGYDQVHVLLNTTPDAAASPTFAPIVSLAVEGDQLQGIAIADYDGDGTPDVAVSAFHAAGFNYYNGAVSVHRNLTAAGASTPDFASPVRFVTANLHGLATGDINGDGRPDLVVSEFSFVSVMLNTTPAAGAQPAFAPLQRIGAGGLRATVGDLDGDGRDDVVSAWSVLLNRTPAAAETATFDPVTTPAAGTALGEASLGDFDGDGLPDLAQVGGNLTAGVMLNETQADGTLAFGPWALFGADGTPCSIAVADLNADGRPDLAVLNQSTNNLILLSNTTGTTANLTFSAGQPITAPYAADLAVADFDLDGKPDLAVASPDTGRLSLVLNRTDALAQSASFAARQDFAVSGITNLVSADFNGDGRPDLAVGDVTTSASILMNVGGSGLLAAPVTLGPGNSALKPAVGVGDFDGDGRPDLAVASYSGTTALVWILPNTTPAGASMPTFAPPQSFGSRGTLAHYSPTLPSLVTGDFNGDGRVDLAVTDGAADRVAVLLNSTAPGAAPTFEPQADFATGYSPLSLRVADFDGDDRPDLAVANYYVSAAGSVSIFSNATAGGASVPAFVRADVARATAIDVADFDGDGRPDLAMTLENNAVGEVMLNTTLAGAPTFSARIAYVLPSHAPAVAAPDFNLDGRPDLAMAVKSGLIVRLQSRDTVVLDSAIGIGTIEPLDLSPDAFHFTDVADAASFAWVASAPLFVGGINDAAPISIAGASTAQYSINGAPFSTSVPASVQDGDRLVTRVVSATAAGDVVHASVTIGGVTDSFDVTTATDTTPRRFSFADRSNVASSASVVSSSIYVVGINAPAPVILRGPAQVAVNGGAFGPAPATLANGDRVQLRVTSAANAGASVNARLNVGGIGDLFTVTTGTDTTPRPFAFADVVAAAPGKLITSNRIRITHINMPAPVNLAGGAQVSVNGGPFAAPAATLSAGDTVSLRILSSGAPGDSIANTLTVGGIADTWTVTTAP
jgi:hypothetical protein